MDGIMYQSGKMQKQMSTEQNIEENAIKRFKETQDAYREWLHKPIHVGNGILDQIKEQEPISFTVEDLYRNTRDDFWPLLDILLEDRPDLFDRIERYKKNPGS